MTSVMVVCLLCLLCMTNMLVTSHASCPVGPLCQYNTTAVNATNFYSEVIHLLAKKI